MKMIDLLGCVVGRKRKRRNLDRLKRLTFEGLEQRLLMTNAPPVIFEFPFHRKYDVPNNLTFNNFGGAVKEVKTPQLDGPNIDFASKESFSQANSAAEFNVAFSATNGELKAHYTGWLEHTTYNMGDYTNSFTQHYYGTIIGWVRAPYYSTKIFREYEYSGIATASQTQDQGGLILAFPGVSTRTSGSYPIRIKERGSISAGGWDPLPRSRVFPQFPDAVYVPTRVGFPQYEAEAPGATSDPRIHGQTNTRLEWDFSLTIRMWIDEGVAPTVNMGSSLPMPWVGSTTTLSNLSMDSDNTDGSNGIMVSKWRIVAPNGTELLTGSGNQVDFRPTVAGLHRVTLTVDDDEGMWSSKEFLIDVTTNMPPVLVSPPATANVLANIPTEIILPENIFSDPDPNQTLSWSISGTRDQTLPGWIHFDTQSRKVTLIPLDSSVGETTVKISVSDSGTPSLTAEVEWRLVVGENPFPMHSKSDPLNVDQDQSVSPLDVLTLVNWLNSGESQVVAKPLSLRPTVFLDVDADNTISPLDVLVVINYLNNPMGGEGESQNLDLELVSFEHTDRRLVDLAFASFANEESRKKKRNYLGSSTALNGSV